jgi:hypothetical protein
LVVPSMGSMIHRWRPARRRPPPALLLAEDGVRRKSRVDELAEFPLDVEVGGR